LTTSSGFFYRLIEAIGEIGRIVGVAKVDPHLIRGGDVAFAFATKASAKQLQVALFPVVVSSLPVFG
jgi:hypothetical protein